MTILEKLTEIPEKVTLIHVLSEVKEVPRNLKFDFYSAGKLQPFLQHKKILESLLKWLRHIKNMNLCDLCNCKWKEVEILLILTALLELYPIKRKNVTFQQLIPFPIL